MFVLANQFLRSFPPINDISFQKLQITRKNKIIENLRLNFISSQPDLNDQVCNSSILISGRYCPTQLQILFRSSVFPDSEENLDFLVFYPKCEVLTKAGYWQSTSAYKNYFLVEKVIRTQLTLIYPNSVMFKNQDAHFYPPPRSLGNQLQ